MDRDKTAKLLRVHEDDKPHAYDDTTGKPVVLASGGKVTIGVGRNVDANGGRCLSPAETEFLLQNDIDEAIHALTCCLEFFAGLSDVRQAVLVDMYHNLGTRLFEFKQTLDYIERGKFGDAAHQMLQSKWATQVKSRAKRLSTMMASDAWPGVIS